MGVTQQHMDAFYKKIADETSTRFDEGRENIKKLSDSMQGEVAVLKKTLAQEIMTISERVGRGDGQAHRVPDREAEDGVEGRDVARADGRQQTAGVPHQRPGEQWHRSLVGRRVGECEGVQPVED